MCIYVTHKSHGYGGSDNPEFFSEFYLFVIMDGDLKFCIVTAFGKGQVVWQLVKLVTSNPHGLLVPCRVSEPGRPDNPCCIRI